MKNLFCILFFLFSTHLSAQEEAPRVHTEIITLAMDNASEELYLFNGEKPVRFRAVPGGIGMPIPYKGPARLILHRKPEAFEVTGEEAPTPVAIVNLPSDSDRVLLLTSNKEGAPLRIQALPVSLKDTRAGDYRFMNFSSYQAFISLNGKTLSLDSGKSKTISGPDAPPSIQDVEVKVGSQTDEGPKIYSSFWGHRSNLRYFIFLFNGPTPNSPLRIQRVHDRVPQ